MPWGLGVRWILSLQSETSIRPWLKHFLNTWKNTGSQLKIENICFQGRLWNPDRCNTNITHCRHYQQTWRWWQLLKYSKVQCRLLSCRRQCRLAHLRAPPVLQPQSHNPSQTLFHSCHWQQHTGSNRICFCVCTICVWVPTHKSPQSH